MFHVGVLRDDPQRPPLPSPPMISGKCAGGFRSICRVLEPVVLAFEKLKRSSVHSPRSARHRLVEHVHPYAEAREQDTVPVLLVLHPGGAVPYSARPPEM